MMNALRNLLLCSLFLVWSADGHIPIKRQTSLGEGSASGGEPCGDYDVRLVRGQDMFQGQVEICSDGTWGAICAVAPFGSWTRTHAIIACRQLELPTESAVAVVYDNFGGPATYSFLYCPNETEESFANCTDFSSFYTHLLKNCSRAGGVICGATGSSEQCTTGDVRLMNMNTASTVAGRVEVCFEGIWGTVCDDEWDGRDASVVCRKLGVNASHPIAVRFEEFGTGVANLSVPILLDYVRCEGQEENVITECEHNGVNVYGQCKHVQDAGVICQAVYPECNDTDLRLMPGDSGLSHVVQVCFSGVWGYVCADAGWDEDDALVACRQLGLILFNTTSSTSKPNNAIIMLSSLNCTGNETRLSDCSHLGVNAFPDCSHVAGVICDTTDLPMEPDTNSESSSVAAIAGALGSVAVVLLILCIAIIGSVIVYRTRMRQLLKKKVPGGEILKHREESDREDFDHKKLVEKVIPRNSIRLLNIIGEGEFGLVYKAHLVKINSQNPFHITTVTQTVAVKTLKGFHDQGRADTLLDEGLRMKNLDHPNILTLIGVCMDEVSTPWIVMPYMANGSLLVHLRREKYVLVDSHEQGLIQEASKRLLSWCLQIAQGMEYLAAKGIVHRDLAARNCMLEEHMVVKIADFGFSENLYTKLYVRMVADGTVKLPVKWMSPESINYGVFSEKSDVWSFGVTCWEIFTGGVMPYPGIHSSSIPNMPSCERIMKKPDNQACFEDMYGIMLDCWMSEADDRPSFSQLVTLLTTHLETLAGGYITILSS